MKKRCFGEPNEKQKLFLLDHHRHVAYGGARGGGKSWAVRTKAKLLALHFAGIKVLIVRRAMPELRNNHIEPLKKELAGIVQHHRQDLPVPKRIDDHVRLLRQRGRSGAIPGRGIRRAVH